MNRWNDELSGRWGKLMKWVNWINIFQREEDSWCAVESCVSGCLIEILQKLTDQDFWFFIVTHLVAWVEWKNRSSGASIQVGSCLTRPPDWPCWPERAPWLRPPPVAAPGAPAAAGADVPALEDGEDGNGDADVLEPKAKGVTPDEEVDRPGRPGIGRPYNSGGRTDKLDLRDDEADGRPPSPTIPGMLGKKLEPEGVGLPVVKPEITGGVPAEAAGLSRADRLNGGPGAREKFNFYWKLQSSMITDHLPSTGLSSGRRLSFSGPSRTGRTMRS